MKKLIYIIASIATLVFTACSTEKDIDLDTNGGKGLTFVHFTSSSESWLATSEDETYVYDIVVAQTEKFAEDKTYEISLGEASTAKEGVDFKMNTKSVTIPAGEYVASFPVEILYDTTGEGFVLDFVLSVDEALINPVYGNELYVKVNTDKIAIDWDWLAGTWEAQDYCYYDGANDGNPYSMKITKVDDTTCTILNLWGTGAAIEGCKVDFDARTITMPTGMSLMHIDAYDADLLFIAVDPDADWDCYYNDDEDVDLDYPVVATMSPAGVVIDNWDFILDGGKYDGQTYGGGYRTTLTK